MVIYIIARGRIAIKGELDRSLEKILELINKVRDNNKRSVWM